MREADIFNFLGCILRFFGGRMHIRAWTSFCVRYMNSCFENVRNRFEDGLFVGSLLIIGSMFTLSGVCLWFSVSG